VLGVWGVGPTPCTAACGEAALGECGELGEQGELLVWDVGYQVRGIGMAGCVGPMPCTAASGA